MLSGASRTRHYVVDCKTYRRLTLNKRMKSTVSVRYISGETTDAIKHNLKVCLEDTSPDNLILHHGTNNLTSGDNSEKSQAILLTLWFIFQV